MEVRTAQTYHQSARQLSDHYDAIGAREGDITLALALAGQPENPHILEIGCGNGRDARVIKRHAGKYIGIDISPILGFVLLQCIMQIANNVGLTSS